MPHKIMPDKIPTFFGPKQQPLTSTLRCSDVTLFTNSLILTTWLGMTVTTCAAFNGRDVLILIRRRQLSFFLILDDE